MLTDKNGLTVTILATYSIALKEFRVVFGIVNLLEVVTSWWAQGWMKFLAVFELDSL
jgi:hypothetical protein